MSNQGFFQGIKSYSSNTLGQFEQRGSGSGAKEFFNSNSLVAKVAFLFLVLISFILLLRWGASILTWFLSPSRSPKIVSGMKDGTKQLIFTQNPALSNSIPIMRSKNQDKGIEFTYTVWLFINDLPLKKGGAHKHIFHKGSGPGESIVTPNSVFNDVAVNDGIDPSGIYGPNHAPGLYIAPDSNTLVVVMNTFKNIQETIRINDIPLNKWINVAIRVEGKNMDVYINGTIALRHVFASIPKQNYGNVYVNMESGFDGFLSDLWYHDYALSGTEVDSIVAAGPDMTMTDDVKIFPKYLSLNWFFENDTRTLPTDPISK
jgi:hypothetical protein